MLLVSRIVAWSHCALLQGWKLLQLRWLMQKAWFSLAVGLSHNQAMLQSLPRLGIGSEQLPEPQS